MRRLFATIVADARIQARNGFYAAAAVVMIASVVLLRWVSSETALFILPAIILGNVLVNTFYFVSGLILLERLEGTLLAQAVTPLRVDEYLAGKVATLTLLSLAESMLILLPVAGAGWWWFTMMTGIALTAALFCLVGVAFAIRYQSINELLLPSVVWAFVLSLPMLGILGVGSASIYKLHPVQATLALMQITAAPEGTALIYAIGYPLAFIVPMYAWSRRAVLQARSA